MLTPHAPKHKAAATLTHDRKPTWEAMNGTLRVLAYAPAEQDEKLMISRLADVAVELCRVFQLGSRTMEHTARIGGPKRASTQPTFW